MKKFLGFLAGSVLFACAAASAQTAYPIKPVRLVVGFPPGGIADLLARSVAQNMSDTIGQQIVVDNRPGAAGSIAAALVAAAQPDGYTLLITAPASQAVVTALSPSLTYDAERDFVPVGKVAELPLVLAVHPSVPATTVRELIAYAKAHPGQLTYGSAGNGSFQHLAAELFSQQAGVKLVHVPYKGSAQILPDLVAGRISMSIDNPATVLPRAKAQELRALAVTSSKSWPGAPEIPTLAQAAGLPDYEVVIAYGIVAPTGTPADVIQKLNAHMSRALNRPEVRQQLLARGAQASPSTAEQFGDLARSETRKWMQVVKDAGIKPN
jgi:tripartite-type tricarboxylate transporter receptor subunit TctC